MNYEVILMVIKQYGEIKKIIRLYRFHNHLKVYQKFINRNQI